MVLQDMYALVRAYVLAGQYQRAIHTIRESKLVEVTKAGCQARHDRFRCAALACKCSATSSGIKSCRFRYLAAKCHIAVEEWDAAIQVLGSNEVGFVSLSM